MTGDYYLFFFSFFSDDGCYQHRCITLGNRKGEYEIREILFIFVMVVLYLPSSFLNQHIFLYSSWSCYICLGSFILAKSFYICTCPFKLAHLLYSSWSCYICIVVLFLHFTSSIHHFPVKSASSTYSNMGRTNCVYIAKVVVLVISS